MNNTCRSSGMSGGDTKLVRYVVKDLVASGIVDRRNVVQMPDPILTAFV